MHFRERLAFVKGHAEHYANQVKTDESFKVIHDLILEILKELEELAEPTQSKLNSLFVLLEKLSLADVHHAAASRAINIPLPKLIVSQNPENPFTFQIEEDFKNFCDKKTEKKKENTQYITEIFDLALTSLAIYVNIRLSHPTLLAICANEDVRRAVGDDEYPDHRIKEIKQYFFIVDASLKLQLPCLLLAGFFWKHACSQPRHGSLGLGSLTYKMLEGWVHHDSSLPDDIRNILKNLGFVA